jgi:hypothetical protein
MQSYDVWQIVGAANMIKNLEVMVEKLFDQANNGSQVVRGPFIGKTVKPGAKDCHPARQRDRTNSPGPF